MKLKPALIFLCFVCIICMAVDCPVPIHYQYQFTDKINIVPEQQIFHIDDTIWLEYSNPNHLLHDKNSNKDINIDSTRQGFSVGINYLTDITDTTNQRFQFVNHYNFQEIYNDDRDDYIQFNLGCNGSRYIKIGWVLKKVGTYSVYASEEYIGICSNLMNSFPQSNVTFQLDVSSCNQYLYYLLYPNLSKEDKKNVEDGASQKRTFYFEVR